MTKDEYLNSLDSAELSNSLVYWTSDTAYSTNAELLLLLDTLYQHVSADNFPSEVKKEEKWMSDYRSRLVAYYDAHTQGKDSLSQYAKADSVLNEGARLLELGCKWSTMEMIVNSGITLTFDECREYGLLTQLVNSCESDEAKDLVYKEWHVYERMLGKIGIIASNMVELNYWGGSIIGPVCTAKYLQISQSRRDMYQTLLNIINSDEWDSTGVDLENAERLLFGCCSTSLKGIVKESDEYLEGNGEESRRVYAETIKGTEYEISELRPIVKEWIALLDKMDYALTHGSSRHHVERAASYMLIKWASIVTEQ